MQNREQQQGQSSEFSALLQEMTASHPASAIKGPSSSKQQLQEAGKQTATPSNKQVPPQKVKKVKKESLATAKKESSKKAKNEDPFSAAISALGNLDISSTMTSTADDVKQQKATEDVVANSIDHRTKAGPSVQKNVRSKVGSDVSTQKQPRPAREGTRQGKNTRDLSPSVAAIFDAVSRKSDEAMGKGDVASRPHPEGGATSQHTTPKAESEGSAALKNLLKIGSPPPPSSPGPTPPVPLPTSTTTRPPTARPPNPRFPSIQPNIRPPRAEAPTTAPHQQFTPEMMEMMQRLVRPPVAPADYRPGLLPNPYSSPPQFPVPGVLW